MVSENPCSKDMLKSQLKIGAALSYLVLGLQNLVGLIYTPFMLRMMGKSEYGLYSIAASVVAYLTILDFGFGNAIVRYTAKYRAEGKLNEQYKMFGMFFLLYCVVGVVTLIVGGILCCNAERVFDAAMSVDELRRTKLVLALMVANLAITFPLSLFGSIIVAYEQFVFQKIVAIIRIFLNTITMVVLLFLGYKAVAMVVVTTIFNLLSLGCNYLYCRRFLKIRLKFGRIQWGFLKEISVFSMWIFMSVVMDKVYWSTGQFVLGAYVGTAAVAVFAVAIQLQRMYMGFSLAISNVFLPKVTAMIVKNADEKVVSDLFLKTGRVQYCVIALILSGFFLFGKSFIVLWAGSGYEDAYVISMIFFIPFTVDLIQNIGLVILQARNQVKFRSILSLLAALGSLGIQIPLAKHYGGIGCAIGIAIGLVVAQVIVMNVYYKIRQKIDVFMFWMNIFKMSIMPIIMTFVCYLILQGFVIDSWQKWVACVGVYLVVYIPLFFLLSMNPFERNLVKTPIIKILKKIS